MSNNPRIRQALDNSEEYIKLMATFSDKRLAEKLDIIHLQSKIAVDKKMEESIELLEIWRCQVISARIYKIENKIPDAPNEIEEVIKDIETYTAKLEEREEILNDFSNPKKQSRPKVQQQKNDDS